MARRPDPQRRQINWPAITSLITAATAVGALVFTSLSLNATREQTGLAEQSQITDRYSRAIEQLGQQGPDQLQIRLGGIYALERLAHDSPRDQPTIVEVLATFVRTSAPSTPAASAPPEFACPADAPTSPRPDVQAALTVLSRRDTTHDNNTVVDLSSSCLRGATLIRANLGGTNLDFVDLSGTKLIDANLADATLTHANLAGVDLEKATLIKTDLSYATLSNASFLGANLRGSYLYRAFLTDASLTDANLTDANLIGANLTRASIADTNLTRADLAGADFSGATLHNANLTQAELVNANFSGTNLNYADLRARSKIT